MATDPNDPRDLHEEDEFVPEDDRVIGQAFRWSLLVFGAIAIVVVGWLLLTREGEQQAETIERDVEAPAVLDQSSAEMPDVAFVDVTAASGVDARS